MHERGGKSWSLNKFILIEAQCICDKPLTQGFACPRSKMHYYMVVSFNLFEAKVTVLNPTFNILLFPITHFP